MSGNFGYMEKSNPLRDIGQIQHVGRCGGRNHVCKAWQLSVKGCECGERGKFAVSYWLDVSPLQHWSHYRVTGPWGETPTLTRSHATNNVAVKNQFPVYLFPEFSIYKTLSSFKVHVGFKINLMPPGTVKMKVEMKYYSRVACTGCAKT